MNISVPPCTGFADLAVTPADAGHGAWSGVHAALRRIAQADPAIQAWSHVGQPAALQAAQDTIPEGALHGIPFAVKDVIDVAGMPTGCGSPAADPAPRRHDASSVALLRRAGAVPVGKTVTAEYAFRQPGPTRNPANPAHTPGGSSSGSAAAVAAGMVPLALGTQTGGSMIRPAAYCGVVGFKPSFGTVFRDGLTQTCESLDVIGWYTRCVADAAAVLRVLSPLGVRQAPAQRPMRIAVVASNPALPLEPEAERALQQACARLAAQGVQVIHEHAFVDSARLNAVHETVMTYEFARSLAPVVSRHAELLSAGLRETVAQGLAVPHEEYLARRAEQETLRHAWDTYFGAADLVLTPSAPGTAPRGLASTGSSAYNKIWSALGWPCLHLPTGHAANGLPIGVQLVAPYHGDASLLQWGGWLHEILRDA